MCHHQFRKVKDHGHPPMEGIKMHAFFGVVQPDGSTYEDSNYMRDPEVRVCTLCGEVEDEFVWAQKFLEKEREKDEKAKRIFLGHAVHEKLYEQGIYPHTKEQEEALKEYMAIRLKGEGNEHESDGCKVSGVDKDLLPSTEVVQPAREGGWNICSKLLKIFRRHFDPTYPE